MAGTIYLNPTKKQKKKKDYIAPKEDTRMTREKKKKKKKSKTRVSRQVHEDKSGKRTFRDTGADYKKEDLFKEAPKVEDKIEDKGIDLTEQGQREELTTGDKIKGLAIGAGIGGTLGLGAVALGAGGVAAGASLLFGSGATATQAAIQSGFAQQAMAQGTTAVSKSGIVGYAPKIASSVTRGFFTNSKTAGLTSSLLGKAFTTTAKNVNPMVLASGLMAVIGTYPFTGFIKEEALQTLGFSTKTSIDSGDFEGAQKSIDQVNEILNPSAWGQILSKVPFANVLASLKSFYEAATTKNAADQETINRAIAEQGRLEEQGESDFSKERRESDEASFERKEEQANKESERYDQIKADNDAEKLADAEIMNEVFRLRREGGAANFAKAEELEKTAYTN